jgi:hypothetical protein
MKAEERADQLFLNAKRKLGTALSITSFLGVIRERSAKTAIERVREVRMLIKEADKILEHCLPEEHPSGCPWHTNWHVCNCGLFGPDGEPEEEREEDNE